MNPVTLQIAIAGIGFIVNALFAMWFFRWRKQEEAPEKNLADIKTALACCVTLKEFQEFRTAFERWLNENGDDVKMAQRDIVDLRVAVKGIQSQINGTGWKRG